MSLIAPARLHFGFLDPTGLSGRQFASLGLVIEGYNVELEARRSKTLILTGDALDEETANFFKVTITRLKKNTSLPMISKSFLRKNLLGIRVLARVPN